jgi:Flp pilus assembly protein TadD
MSDTETGATVEEALAQAIALHNNGNLIEAETMYRQLLEVDPENADVLHLLGMVAYQAGSFYDAVTLMDRSIALRPNEEMFRAHRNAAAQAAAVGGGQERDEIFGEVSLEQAYNIALSHFTSGRSREAELLLTKVITASPAHVESLHLLGIVLLSRSDFEGAQVQLQRAAELCPTDPTILSNLANLYLQKGNRAEAEVLLRKVCALNPDSVEAQAALDAVIAGSATAV